MCQLSVRGQLRVAPWLIYTPEQRFTAYCLLPDWLANDDRRAVLRTPTATVHVPFFLIGRPGRTIFNVVARSHEPAPTCRRPQYDLPIFEYVSHRMEIRKMNRKWLVFPLSAGVLLVLGIVAGPGLYGADDDESPLGKIMEKVNKHNSTITKGTRNKVNFAKSRKDVEKSAKELVKLGKEAKPIKDAVKKAKVADPQKKWDEYMDDFIKTSEKLGEVTAQSERDL